MAARNCKYILIFIPISESSILQWYFSWEIQKIVQLRKNITVNQDFLLHVLNTGLIIRKILWSRITFSLFIKCPYLLQMWKLKKYYSCIIDCGCVSPRSWAFDDNESQFTSVLYTCSSPLLLSLSILRSLVIWPCQRKSFSPLMPHVIVSASYLLEACLFRLSCCAIS